jgi:hypothetical protein
LPVGTGGSRVCHRHTTRTIIRVGRKVCSASGTNPRRRGAGSTALRTNWTNTRQSVCEKQGQRESRTLTFARRVLEKSRGAYATLGGRVLASGGIGPTGITCAAPVGATRASFARTCFGGSLALCAETFAGPGHAIVAAGVLALLACETKKAGSALFALGSGESFGAGAGAIGGACSARGTGRRAGCRLNRGKRKVGGEQWELGSVGSRGKQNKRGRR